MLYQLSYASDESRSRSIALTLMPGTKQFKLPQRLIDVQGRVVVFIVFSVASSGFNEFGSSARLSVLIACLFLSFGAEQDSSVIRWLPLGAQPVYCHVSTKVAMAPSSDGEKSLMDEMDREIFRSAFAWRAVN
jgi:hypothetical protein